MARLSLAPCRGRLRANVACGLADYPRARGVGHAVGCSSTVSIVNTGAWHRYSRLLADLYVLMIAVRSADDASGLPYLDLRLLPEYV
jgi:hypothetical protein